MPAFQTKPIAVQWRVPGPTTNPPLRSFRKRLPPKHVSLPSIDVVNLHLPNQLVAANPGQDNSPEEPVDASSENDANTDNAVDPVGEAFVDVLSFLRRNEWCHGEVDITEEEEEDDRESGADGRVPVPGLAMKVEMDESASNEYIDNGERIGNEAGRRKRKSQ